MLSLLELEYHCRTCLIKIEKVDANEDSSGCVSINKYPEVEQFMGKCLRVNDINSLALRLDLYMPNICCICFEKWKGFYSHYLLAIKNEEILRKILEREEIFEEADEKHEEPTKEFLPTDTTDDPTSQSNTPVLCQNDEEHRNGKELSCSDEVEHNESRQSPKVNTIESADEGLLKNRKNSQPIDEQNNKIKIKKQPTRRSKRKSKIDQPDNKRKDQDLDESNETTTKKVVYRCEPCKKFFYGSITYEAHIKRDHEGVKKAYPCKACEKAFSTIYYLREHVASVHKKVTLHCNLCNKPFKNKASLKYHLRSHHRDKCPEPKRIVCDQCGFLAAHQTSLTQHIKNKHSEVEAIKCDQCSKVYKSRYYLKNHMLSSHNDLNIKPFKCPHCPMAFSRRPRLNMHIGTHLTYSERIKCDFEDCNVRFVKLTAKRRHMRLVHLKVKQHVCDICGEAFGAKVYLRHHRYIHTGEKPYKCNDCGQAFRQFSAMHTHRKMHVKKGETQDAGTTTTYTDTTSSQVQSTSLVKRLCGSSDGKEKIKPFVVKLES